MRRWIRLGALLLALAPARAAAQAPEARPATAEEQEVVRVAQAAFQAAQRGDAGALAPLLAETYLLRGPDGEVRTREVRLAEVAAAPPSPGSRMVAEHVRVAGDVGVVLGRIDVWDGEGQGGARRPDRRYRVMHVLVRGDGGWKVAAVESAIANPPAPHR